MPFSVVPSNAVSSKLRGRFVTGWISRNAWSKGVVGDSSVWFFVFCVAVVVGLAKKLLKRQAEVVHTEHIPVGSSIMISHTDSN